MGAGLKAAALAAIVCAAPSYAAAQDLSKLPDWARAAVENSRKAAEPADAEAWVLLDRTEIAYAGDGEVRVHHYRVVKVLGERGVDEAFYRLSGASASTTKVKKLKGWNLRPDGEVTKLDKDDAVTLSGSVQADGAYDTSTVTMGVLDRAAKGSLLAFESLEIHHKPIGPIDNLYVMEDVPVLRWECAAAKKEGWFSNLKQVDLKMDLHRFEGWGLQVEKTPGSVAVSNIPALPKAEPFQPDAFDLFPSVVTRFLDPAFKDAPDWAAWDGLAAYTSRSFSEVGAAPLPALDGADAGAKLQSLAAWMYGNLSYHQVYLTPARGWVPERPAETNRKRYGDCKDFSAFLLSGAKQLGFQAAPVLVRINDGAVDPSMSPGPWFNHAISAIRLDKSLGLPAEVQTEAGRFLLVDPTDHYTPLGHLGGQHRGRWAMICLPDKAVWVQVPDAAVLKETLLYTLNGAVDSSGVFEGTLRIEERGDAYDLRRRAMENTAKDFSEYIRNSVLSLNAAAGCEVAGHSAPMALAAPFTVDVKLRVAEVMTSDGTEFDLRLPGFPGVPVRPFRNGAERKYPFDDRSALQMVYKAALKLPFAANPIASDLDAATARRSYTWHARKGDEKGKLELALDMTWKDARFGFADLKQGVQAFSADRASMLRLTQDGLAFKPGP